MTIAELTRSWRHEQVRVTDLRIDPTYHDPQRLDPKRAERMAEGWDDELAGDVTVSDRGDGDLVVIDGFHRVSAARKAGRSHIAARVYFGIDRQREAQIFVGLSDAVALKPMAKFLARLGADDPVAVDIVAILRDCDVELARHGGGARRPNSSRSINVLELLYHSGLLASALRVVREAWPEDQRGLDSVPLRAVGSFLYVYDGSPSRRPHPHFGRERLVAKLSELPASALIRTAAELRALPGNTGTSGAHKAIKVGAWTPERRAALARYNQRLREPLPDVGQSELKRLAHGQSIW